MSRARSVLSYGCCFLGVTYSVLIVGVSLLPRAVPRLSLPRARVRQHARASSRTLGVSPQISTHPSRQDGVRPPSAPLLTVVT